MTTLDHVILEVNGPECSIDHRPTFDTVGCNAGPGTDLHARGLDPTL